MGILGRAIKCVVMSEIVDRVMLVKVAAAENNNKFYEVQLDASGVVHKRWGRVGNDGQRSREATGRAGFDRTIAAKERRGYTRVAVVGAAAKVDVAGNDKERVRDVSRMALAIDPGDTAIATLIDRLVEKNKHEILAASGGLIQISASGVIETPLGIIEAASLVEAGRLLDRLEARKNVTTAYKEELEAYLSLVPQKLPAKRGWEADFFKDNPIDQQRQLLTQLRDSYAWYETERKAKEAEGNGDDDTDYTDFFTYRLRSLGRGGVDRDTFKRIEALFKGSANRHHRRVADKRLHRVYALDGNGAVRAFDDIAARIGNVQELWHGSRVGNVLSILRQGLVLPENLGTADTTGAMFGPGLYFSNQSTKSLNYSDGYWAGARENDCFMFLTQVACGKEFRPRHYSDWRQSRKGGYDCINVKAGTGGVMNHELIVWDTNQVKLSFLCEFT